MKETTKLLHNFVKNAKLDSLFAKLGQHVSFMNKCVPLHHEYAKGTLRQIWRNGACYSVDVSDYAQWMLFGNVPDYSWQFALHHCGDNAVILDVGANVGQFCLKLASQSIKKRKTILVHAFEPNPFVFHILSKNKSLNPAVGGSVILHPIAVGDKLGKVFFSFSSSNSGGGTLSTEPTAVQVDIISLDAWADQIELSTVDFVKIDVEGLEPIVLKGAENLIRKFKPMLYVEITDRWFVNHGYSWSQIFHQLRSWDYEIYHDNAGFSIPINSSESMRGWSQFNIIASHKKLESSKNLGRHN